MKNITPAEHRHSRYIEGCGTCELDKLYLRVTLGHYASKADARAMWLAGDSDGLAALLPD